MSRGNENKLRTADQIGLSTARERLLYLRAQRKLVEFELLERSAVIALAAASLLLAICGALLQPDLLYGAAITSGSGATLTLRLAKRARQDSNL